MLIVLWRIYNIDKFLLRKHLDVHSFYWTVTVLCNLYVRSPQAFYPEITDFAFGMLFLLVELVIFFDLSGSKFLKNLEQFSLKSTTLSAIISKNERKIKKIQHIKVIIRTPFERKLGQASPTKELSSVYR